MLPTLSGRMIFYAFLRDTFDLLSSILLATYKTNVQYSLTLTLFLISGIYLTCIVLYLRKYV